MPKINSQLHSFLVVVAVFVSVALTGTWARRTNNNNQLAFQDDGSKWSWASVCSLPPETGPCRAAFPRFYFNAASRTCAGTFLWGGCGGNANRFMTAEECTTACGAQG